MMSVGEKRFWLPPGTRKVEWTGRAGLLIIEGPSGVGKTWLMNQLAQDPEIVEEGILYMPSESLGQSLTKETVDKLLVKEVEGVETVKAVAREMKAAALDGAKVPGYGIWDSVTGSMLKTAAYYRDHPVMTVDKKTKEESHDRWAEFAKIGWPTIDALTALRDVPGMLAIAFVTSHEGSKWATLPEVAAPGDIVPKHLTQTSSLCLYMRAEKVSYDPGATKVADKPHRTIGYDEKGNPTGEVVDRYFTTINTGEVSAKGHSALALKERAILPDVIRKIRGTFKESK